MRPLKTYALFLLVVLATAVFTGALTSAQQGLPEAVEFQFYETGVAAERLHVVGEATAFKDWPRPETLFVAPQVGRTLFAAPEQLGREVQTCTPVRFAGEPWGRCDWSWREVNDNGWLDLALTLAPTAGAAQEYLLAALSDNMLPAEAAAAMMRDAARPEGLGDAAFFVTARDGADVRLDFVRANLVVRIRARDGIAAAALDLGRRLDAEVLNQQPLSRDALLARRPVVELADAVDADAVPYQVRVPGERRVVATRALVDGQSVAAAEGGVALDMQQSGRVVVEVVVITAELLAGESSKELLANP